MKYGTDAMAAVLTHDTKTVHFSMFLDHCANITKPHAGSNLFDTEVHTFLGDADQAVCQYAGLAYNEHFARITVITVLEHGHVYVDDIAVF